MSYKKLASIIALASIALIGSPCDDVGNAWVAATSTVDESQGVPTIPLDIYGCNLDGSLSDSHAPGPPCGVIVNASSQVGAENAAAILANVPPSDSDLVCINLGSNAWTAYDNAIALPPTWAGGKCVGTSMAVYGDDCNATPECAPGLICSNELVGFDPAQTGQCCVDLGLPCFMGQCCVGWCDGNGPPNYRGTCQCLAPGQPCVNVNWAGMVTDLCCDGLFCVSGTCQR